MVDAMGKWVFRPCKRALGSIVVTLLSVASTSAWSQVACTENITAVIVHTNGNIYFQSSQTCPGNWCQLPGTGTLLQNEYAVLLTAASTGAMVTFYWASIPSCSTTNALYAQPGYLSLAGIPAS
jgi:hypothetical protein